MHFNNIASELNIYIIKFLSPKDSMNFNMINKTIQNDTINTLNLLKYKVIINKIKTHLFDYDYYNFTIQLNYLKLNFHNCCDYKDILNNLLNILFNHFDIKLPTVWKSHSCGFYDVRFLFELLFYGGSILETDILDYHSKLMYKLYYDKIKQNIVNDKSESIINLLTIYPYDSAISLLKYNHGDRKMPNIYYYISL